ncbi:MAG: 1-(5-phosphoribosyl)-5-[(5-phosphoribosylamino)methylideneamino]imidazole-4-carboxamide isomerase [Saprospiraceae bacterium]
MTKIFPAIDIIGGQCVRLSKGDYDTVKVYDNDPLDMAKRFKDAGATYLHVVDLDAAKNPSNHNRKLIGQIITEANLLVQTGGGIRTEDDIRQLLDIGADRLILGSVAVTQKEKVFQWLSTYGGHRLVVGADVKDGMIATHGWLETSDQDIMTFIKEYMTVGAETFLCTEISKDGMMAGAAKELYLDIMQELPGVGLIASGGVHDMGEVHLLQEMRMEAIIIGKAIYEGAISLEQLFQKQTEC